ncbi:Uncharacterised protein [Mycobacterium tuberculosis]|uniref:Uncharacterized protein n=1 Tax=Mycobacterium tuberculosis TaxID=1773 RepID=A0A916PD24_MYCTX|nr:Uncharacterised protein [Mycobacterium tuberculosis]
MPVCSTNSRITLSACAYAAPLLSTSSGRCAWASTSSARSIASGAGSSRGAGSTGRQMAPEAADASTAWPSTSPGISRYTPPGRPEVAVRMARATPRPMSWTWPIRYAAFTNGRAALSWSRS